jgi:hypothetical protein
MVHHVNRVYFPQIIPAFVLVMAILACFSGSVQAMTTPSWLKPGTVLTYELLSGGKTGVNPDVYLMINSVNSGFISYSVKTPGSLTQYTWRYGGIEDPCFWVDPENPTGSVLSPIGMKYTIVGSMDGADTNFHWNGNIVSMVAQVPDSRYVLMFDEESGLVLSFSHETPISITYMFYRSMEEY